MARQRLLNTHDTDQSFHTAPGAPPRKAAKHASVAHASLFRRHLGLHKLKFVVPKRKGSVATACGMQVRARGMGYDVVHRVRQFGGNCKSRSKNAKNTRVNMPSHASLAPSLPNSLLLHSLTRAVGEPEHGPVEAFANRQHRGAAADGPHRKQFNAWFLSV